jgi:ABC-type Fe3+ transport system substrate-binding protein
MIRILSVAAALIVTIAAPFLLRPAREAGTAASSGPSEALVIISPHSESIRAEFSRAFNQHMRKSAGRDVRLDWRVPGGTSEIEKFIHSSFVASFENYWKKTLKRKWKGHTVGDAFNNRHIDPGGESESAEARRLFLESNVGIGIDLFFGGGEYPFVGQARAGHLIDSGIFDRRPEWFSGDEPVIPSHFSGERYYDPDRRWIGTCLSSFGIVYNTDSLELIGITEPPSRWTDLGDPRYFGNIALADPTKSGSATKAFEMLIQQHIHQSVVDLRAQPPDPARIFDESLEDRALHLGWLTGLNLIQRICANARYFTDNATKIPFDVTQGNAAAGMCIDFYGRTSNERVRHPDGSSRVHFVVPERGTSISVDPIGMLRGAPQPDLALEFIDFVLSEKGQRLWNYQSGNPGGPASTALRRLPLRRDLYTPEHLAHFSDPGEMPYDEQDGFEYVAGWTAPAFGPLRFIVKCMCLDAHDELTYAWSKLVEAQFPPEATEVFFDVEFVEYEKAVAYINDTIRSGYKISEVALGRKLTAQFRNNYLRAAELARQGR